MSQQPVCQTCSRTNDSDMQFCIFCGGTLKPGSMSGRKPTVAGEMCQSCGKTDALNGKFCVLCGSRISKPAPQAESASYAAEGAGAEVPAVVKSAGKPARRGGGPMPLLLVVCIMAGAALGCAGAWLGKPHAPALHIPENGVALLTGKPFATVCLQNEDGRDFVVGSAGSDGNFYFPQAEASSYQYTKDSTVNDQPIGQPVVIKQNQGVLDLQGSESK